LAGGGKIWLKPWFRTAQLDHGFAFHYGQHFYVFRGRSGTELLPSLVALLDGTRDEQQVIAAMGGFPSGAVRRALAELHDRGLLMPKLNGELERNVSQTEAFFLAQNSGIDAVRRFRGARVQILGDGGHAGYVREALEKAGLTCREGREYTDGDWLESDLVIGAPSPAQYPLLSKWNEYALAAQRAWLPTIPFDGHCAVAGPLCLPGRTACFECFTTRRFALTPFGIDFRELDASPGHWPQTPAIELLLAGAAAQMASRYLIGERDVAGTSLIVDAAGQSQSFKVLRVPRCEACYHGPGRSPQTPLHAHG